MKEIGIEKLIELLNEYEQEEGCWGLKYGKLHNKYYDDYDQKDEEIRLISKWYGFIKWLVENDKIDRDKVKEEYQYMEYEPFDYMEYFFKKDGWLIMLLSISDTPIDDLISYLK